MTAAGAGQPVASPLATCVCRSRWRRSAWSRFCRAAGHWPVRQRQPARPGRDLADACDGVRGGDAPAITPAPTAPPVGATPALAPAAVTATSPPSAEVVATAAATVASTPQGHRGECDAYARSCRRLSGESRDAAAHCGAHPWRRKLGRHTRTSGELGRTHYWSWTQVNYPK